MAKRVAVLGAGASGLTAIKCCLDEDLVPVCFERTDEIGGLWHYTDKAREEQASVMRSTVINSSKELSSFSDFPAPKEYPNFMHNTQVWAYFKMYADKFDLLRHIRYNTEVTSVKQCEDFASTGRWKLTTKDHKSGEEKTEVFDAVLVCTGHHASKNVPHFTGQEDFKGEIIHSHDYRDWERYGDKRIVVVGFGNSGVDVAVELSRVGQVYISTRRGAWVFNRIGDNGLPSDISFSRFALKMASLMSPETMANIVEGKLNKRFDHKLYSVQPKHRFYAQHPTVNDELPNRIATGTLKIKADVKRFLPNGVEFVDGTIEDNIDSVILATGYVFGFPFIDKSVIDVQKNRAQLYKYMFPPDLEKQTLAVIGFIQPLGSTIPIAEMQCRVATRVFKGLAKLPSREEMLADIGMKKSMMAARYVESQRHTIQVDFTNYMDQLGELIGCKPDFRCMLLTDPQLAMKCYFGPSTPYQWRLVGPGAWLGARDAIMTQMDRIRYPFKTKPLPEGVDVPQKSFSWLTLVLLVLVLAILIKLFL